MFFCYVSGTLTFSSSNLTFCNLSISSETIFYSLVFRQLVSNEVNECRGIFDRTNHQRDLSDEDH